MKNSMYIFLIRLNKIKKKTDTNERGDYTKTLSEKTNPKNEKSSLCFTKSSLKKLGIELKLL